MTVASSTIKTLSQESFDSVASKSILESALLNNVIFEYSCKNGQCGVCKTNLIEGDVAELKPQLALTDSDRLENKILTCCCEAVGDILIDSENLSALQDVEVKTLPSRISRIVFLSKDIVEVTLRFPPAAMFRFLEGQYLDVIWNGIRRSYSIASNSLENEVVLLIKKVKGGVMSEYWFDKAKENDLIRVEGPSGTFFLRDGNDDLVFLATGTGIAPVKAILEQINQRHETEKQDRNIYLFWGNRSADDFVWDARFTNINVQSNFVVSRADSGWKGLTGYVQDIALDVLGGNVSNCQVYACGSNTMIQSANQLFVKSGLAENNFYSDAFVQSF